MEGKGAYRHLYESNVTLTHFLFLFIHTETTFLGKFPIICRKKNVCVTIKDKLEKHSESADLRQGSSAHPLEKKKG